MEIRAGMVSSFTKIALHAWRSAGERIQISPEDTGRAKILVPLRKANVLNIAWLYRHAKLYNYDRTSLRCCRQPARTATFGLALIAKRPAGKEKSNYHLFFFFTHHGMTRNKYRNTKTPIHLDSLRTYGSPFPAGQDGKIFFVVPLLASESSPTCL